MLMKRNTLLQMRDCSCILFVKATQDESEASKEVINVLRKQIQTLQREKETLSAMKPELSEGQLLDILRWE